MLAGEAIEAGEFSGEMFWKAVKTIQDLLSDAADSTCGGSFRYCRLPEFKQKCSRCEVAGLPCLKTSKTGTRTPVKLDSNPCQVCFARGLECNDDSGSDASDDDDIQEVLKNNSPFKRVNGKA